MHAAVIREFGPPSVLHLEDVPDPQGECLVAVSVASITFVETQIRAGRAPNPAMLPPLPAILGNGVGGTVGGRRVVTALNGTGGYATLAAAARESLIDVPKELKLEDAVALLADGRTALLLAHIAAIQPGETVLVEAAAGGVGSLLLQLARRTGAEVIALAGGTRKLAVARDLGASVAIDYREPNWPVPVGPVNVVFDGVGGAIGRQAFELLRPGGRYVPFGMASGAMADVSDSDAAARSVTVLRLPRPTPDEARAASAEALSLAAAGQLRPLIGQRLPLAEAAAAHQAIESRTTIGKTLLLP
jgi:NADPH2:quinone reductase